MTRTVTVTFADGSTHQYNNIPDETTPDQVLARIAKDFPNKEVKALDGGKKPTPPLNPPVDPTNDGKTPPLNPPVDPTNDGKTPPETGDKKWPTTPDEIKAFQKVNLDPVAKLAVDGVIGSHTYKALINAGYKPPPDFAGVTAYKESVEYFINKMRMLEADAAPTATAGTPPPPAAAPAAEDPTAVIAKYTDHPELPAYIDSKTGKVMYMGQEGEMNTPTPKVMPTDWIQRYAPDLAAALKAQGGNQQGYGQQQKSGLFGIKGLGNFDQGTKVNTKQAGADVTSAKAVQQIQADAKQLTDLVAKLKTFGQAQLGADGKPTAASIANPNNWGQAESIQESMSRIINKLTLLEATGSAALNPNAPGATAATTIPSGGLENQANQAPAPAAPAPAAPAPAAPQGKPELIKQIQDLMKKINDASGPDGATDPTAIAALQAAQQALDAETASVAADQKAKIQGGHDAAIASGAQDDVTGVDAAVARNAAAPVAAQAANRDSMPFGQAFADAKAKGEKQFTWKGKPYAVKESTNVTFKENETLARIVDLARR